MLKDFEKAPIAEKEKALLRYLDVVIARSWTVTAEDVERVRKAGWTDEAIYDAVSVCAIFKFYNTWCDSTGVHPMSLEAHAESGKRIATLGYTW